MTNFITVSTLGIGFYWYQCHYGIYLFPWTISFWWVEPFFWNFIMHLVIQNIIICVAVSIWHSCTYIFSVFWFAVSVWNVSVIPTIHHSYSSDTIIYLSRSNFICCLSTLNIIFPGEQHAHCYQLLFPSPVSPFQLSPHQETNPVWSREVE